MSTSDLKSFHYLENGEITFSVLDTIKTVKTLDYGFYNLSVSNSPNGGKLDVKVITDKETIKVHSFPDKQKLDKLFEAFFDERVVAKMSVLGFNHKVGVLLYGKEGTGKSTIIKSYAKKMMDKDKAIVFYINGNIGLKTMWEFICKVRAVQNNPIIVIFEEVDDLLYNGLESQLKKILDGNESIDNCVVFASTNYIDKIPSAIKNRPSRFKYTINVEGIDSLDDVLVILTKLIGDMFETDEILEFAKKLVGSSLDVIKQFALDKIMSLETYKIGVTKKIGFSKGEN